MTPPPEGTPWWVWLVAVVAVALVSALSAVGVAHIANRPTRKRLERVQEQVENDHADHPFPNLRQQLDAIHEDTRLGRRETEGLRGEVREARAWIAAEAVERRKLAEVFAEHLEQARRRDQRLDELTDAIRGRTDD